MLNIFSKIFGTKNDKEVKRYRNKALEINALEAKYEALSDEELKSAIEELKNQVQKEEKTLDDVLYDSFAIERLV